MTNSSEVSAIDVNDVAAALGRCLEVHPPAENEGQLHADANALAELYGTMVYSRATTCPAEALLPHIGEVLRRWMPGTGR
jgi:Protein of unknown function (DUF3717)